jgi:nucleotide-binding universal stress UspA family protein
MPRKILVPIDLEHGARVDEVLRIAADFAAAGEGEVELLTVVEAAPVVVSQFLPESYETISRPWPPWPPVWAWRRTG